MARSLREADADIYSGAKAPGYYQRVSLDDIINSFMVGYVGKDKVLQSIPRHEVAFYAQRALQEFSYDILHSDKSIEIELGPTKSMLLPSDYVNYVRVTRTDQNGNTQTVPPSTTSKPSRAVLQDQNYNPIFDSSGDFIITDESESIKRWKTHDYDEERRAIDYYNGFYYNDDFSYYNQKRFGLQPTLVNQNNWTYLLDANAGIIYFNKDFLTGDIVTLYYISDGLGDNGDLTNVYVPKMAEDAMYKTILYNLAKLRPAAAQLAQLYGKESRAAIRNTKIRLMNLKSEEMIDVMRGKSKWIKH